MNITNKWLQEHLTQPIDLRYGMKKRSKHIICVDGTTLSVQASETHYCTPRENTGPYTQVEVGFPSVMPGWWEDPEEDVNGWVPIGQVIDFVNDHGGVQQ